MKAQTQIFQIKYRVGILLQDKYNLHLEQIKHIWDQLHCVWQSGCLHQSTHHKDQPPKKDRKQCLEIWKGTYYIPIQNKTKQTKKGNFVD